MSKSIKTHHYTYIIRHVNGKYYVGRRSTKKDPLLDPYLGSGHWVKKIKDRSTLTKTIIAYYPTIEELKIAEMELIDKYFLDEYCMNVSYSSCGGNTGNYKSGDKNHMYGKSMTKETKQKISNAISGDKHPMYGRSGELSPRFGVEVSEKSKQLMSRPGDKNPMFGKRGELNPRFGTTHTNETKQKMSAAQSGDKHPRTSITDRIVRLIKIRISEGIKDRPIAEEFNTTKSVVSGIRHNITWKHVTI